MKNGLHGLHTVCTTHKPCMIPLVVRAAGSVRRFARFTRGCLDAHQPKRKDISMYAYYFIKNILRVLLRKLEPQTPPGKPCKPADRPAIPLIETKFPSFEDGQTVG